jgi:hypothetical protein
MSDPEKSWKKIVESSKALNIDIIDRNGLRTVFQSNYRLSALQLDDIRIREGWSISMKAISEMQIMANAHGVKLLVLSIPTKERAYKQAVDKYELDLSEKYRTLVSNEERIWEDSKIYFQEHKIDYVYALPKLEAYIANGKNPYSPNVDGHPNPLGQRAIAEAVWEKLENKN